MNSERLELTSYYIFNDLSFIYNGHAMLQISNITYAF